MQRSPKMLIIPIAMALMATIPAKANLITNGSFEAASISPGSFTNVAAGSTAITGWTVTLGNIDYIGSLWGASNGSRSLDLEGSAGTCNLVIPNCPGGIAQTFSTVAGQQYDVMFDLAGNPFNVPIIKTVSVSAAGQSQNFSFNVTGHSSGSMGWTTHTWTFTASGSTTTLEFDTADNPATGWGPALDNVNVALSSTAPPESTVPEPSTILLLGVGLIALAACRKQRKQA